MREYIMFIFLIFTRKRIKISEKPFKESFGKFFCLEFILDKLFC